MYQITRNHIVEELEISDNGKKLQLKVDISADAILTAYNKAQYKLAEASIMANKAKDDKDTTKAEEAMGNAVLGLFEVVFGESQTQKIVKFYDNRYLEMLGDIAPFISDVITPKVQEAQKRIGDRYKQVASRK
jgi:hypothetical protein